MKHIPCLAIAAVAALFVNAVMVPAAYAAPATYTVSDGAGDDTAAIQAALDDAYAHPGADVVELGPVLAGGCYDLQATDLSAPSSGLDKATALVLRSDPGNELEFNGNDQPMCRHLAPQPAGTAGNPNMAWFRLGDADGTTGVTGLTVHNLNVDGGAAGNEDPADRASFLDFLFWWRPAVDFTFSDSTVTRMYGLCGIGSALQNSTFSHVHCANPQKAAFNIQGESFDDDFIDVTGSSTGDDAIAFNATVGGVPHDNTIHGGTFWQDPRNVEGGSLSIRGGNHISAVADSAGRRPRFGQNTITPASNNDAILITKSPNSQPIDIDSSDITIDSADVFYAGSHTAATFIGPDTLDVTISNTTINYPGCPVYGIWTGTGTPDPAGLSTDTFIPDGSCNLH